MSSKIDDADPVIIIPEKEKEKPKNDKKSEQFDDLENILDESDDQADPPDKEDDCDVNQISSYQLDDEQNQCGICLSAFNQGEELKILNCQSKIDENDEEEKASDTNKQVIQHVFHSSCITEWFFKKVECPMCRATFHDEIDQSQRFQEEDGDEEEKNGGGLPDEEEVRMVR